MSRPMLITKDHIIVKRRSVVYLVGLVILLAVLACNFASNQQATLTPTLTMAVTTTSQVCGDGVCAAPEDATTCLADCAVPTAAITPASQGARVKTTQQLNVRFGPSVNCAVLGSYPKDSEVEVLAKNPDGLWWQVPFGASVGWLSAPYTTPVTDLSAVQTIPGPYCEPPTHTPVPPTNTPVPPTITPTLAAVCGNGVIETGETCDTTDTCAGILVCGSNCQCKSPLIIVTLLPLTLQPLLPVCGNGVVEAGEACDGPGTCNLGYICNTSCQCKQILIQP
jgi:hypothetical protein